MFNQLSDNLEKTFRNLRGLGKISEKNVEEALREVRMSLLEADVDFNVTKDFIAEVKELALGGEVLRSVTPGQQVVKIFNDRLTEFLGGDHAPLDLSDPKRILMVGLNGAGKTTSSAKLALRLKKDGKRPLLVACDLYRPAAIEQLAVLAAEIEVPIFRPAEGETDLLAVADQALKWVEEQGGGIAIFDSAGRQEVDADLLYELKKLKDKLEPKEVLLVADAATGQQAVSVAQQFQEDIGITGLLLSKLDGDARGGAALSMRRVTGCPIKLVGVGEKMDQLEEFHPDRMANRILGMGDVVGMVEKAAEEIDANEAMRMAEKMKKATFDFDDFLSQMRMMQKLPLEGLLSMIPGAKKMKNLQVDEKKLKHIEAIILSMTPQERSRPEIIKATRRKRLAAGSGTSVMEVNRLLKQFGEMRKMMKNKGKMKQMMDMMGGGGGMKGMPKLPF